MTYEQDLEAEIIKKDNLIAQMEDELKELHRDEKMFRIMSVRLWELLDNIDTLDDSCRENDSSFRSQAMFLAQQRAAYMESPDGQVLEVTGHGKIVLE
jgi:hypothetical protein